MSDNYETIKECRISNSKDLIPSDSLPARWAF